MIDLYCKIYLNTDLNLIELEELLFNKLNGKIINWNIHSNSYSIYILKNDEYNIFKISNNLEDSFLYYKFILEVNYLENSSQNIYIKELSDLLCFFFSLGFNAVPSCDFEELLPKRLFDNTFLPKLNLNIF